MDVLIKELKIEQVPEGLYREIAEGIGIENLIKLTQIIGGSTIYFPKTESILRPVRDAKIRDEFNGYNHMELAKKYNVTDRWVRQLCGDGFLEGQVTLFDCLDSGEKAL